MKIDPELIRQLRLENAWSQEKLSIACGLDLRTVQRIESSGRASLESVKALASVFDVTPNSLTPSEKEPQTTPLESVKTGFREFSNFSGTMARFEYWWFFLAVLLLCAVAAIVSEVLLQLVSVIILLPLIAAGTRRLRDAGYSGWWQLLTVVPFGAVVVIFLLVQTGEADKV